MSPETQLASFGVILVAAFLGGLIGLEREIRRKSAGIRTHAFIAAAGALLTVLSTFLITTYQTGDQATNADPVRILHSLVIGISFIGGGMIFHTHGSALTERVKNLTTASSILLTALVGAATGLQLFYLASTLTALILVTNILVRYLETRFIKHKSLSNE